jgi:hypothetical protein
MNEPHSATAGPLRSWKRGCLWGAICVIAVLLFSVVAISVKNRNDQQAESARLRSQRSRVKIHIGDDPRTVRLRLGVPDTIITNAPDSNSFWFFGGSLGPAGSTGGPTVVSFSSRKGNLLVTSIFFGMDPSKHPWTPEDLLAPYSFEKVDDVLDSFSKVLGQPCRTIWDDDSTFVRYLFRLSKAELAEDSIYRRSVEEMAPDYPYRSLRVDLRGGKKVMNHGWTVTRRGAVASGGC